MSRRPFVCLLLALVAALGLGHRCVAEESAVLHVAAFSCDVTPPVGGHPLIWITPVATVEEPLLAKGIVLDDGKARYVLCAVDWCGLCNSTHELFRRKLAEAVRAEPGRVALHTVHQHTAPYTDGDAQRLLDKEENPPKYADFKFLEEVTDRLAAAAKESLARLEPFDRVGTGHAKVDRVASNRRIIGPDGKLRGRMSSCKDPELRALPEGRIDPLLRTVTLARGGEPLVRLHYYATHPQSFYGDPRASSDVPGFARERLQKKEGAFQIYFTGCAGDVAMGKYNDGTREARDELTGRLYVAMEASAAATRYVPAEKIEWRTLPVKLSPRSDPGHAADDARRLVQDAKAAPIARIRAACRVAYAQRAQRPLDVSLLRIGPAGVLCLPGECTIEYQLFAQGLNPGQFLAVAAYGDLAPGYVCTEKSFAEGGYEPSASQVEPKSEAVLKGAIRELLAPR